VDRIRVWAAKDAADLEPELRQRADARRETAAEKLAERGQTEAAALRDLLQQQRKRIAEADKEAEKEDKQLVLFDKQEAEQRHRAGDWSHEDRRSART
jgi:uncharacterized protein HemX